MSDSTQTNPKSDGPTRFAAVALIGRTNVGKSTFLNAVLKERLAIVSPLPQTTRDTLLGVAYHDNAQLAFMDTPGLHRPRTELGRRMNAAAMGAARATDVVVFMTDVSSLLSGGRRPTVAADADLLLAEDRTLIAELPDDTPAIAVINKADLLKNKSLLLPMLKALDDTGRFEACIPVSLLARDGTERVLSEIVRHAPESAPAYDPDTLTDRPINFFVREYIREQVLHHTSREVPHAVAVSIDRFEEGKRLVRIAATLHVEKDGQRGIIVGRGGERLKQIGTAARLRIEDLVGRKVHLELFVRVSPRWKDMPRQLAELGYDGPGDAAPPGRHS